MTKLKRRKNNFLKLILITLFLNSPFVLKSEENQCRKFDIKCKTFKYLDDTKEFQKKGLKASKKQLKDTKDKIIKTIPKKN